MRPRTKALTAAVAGTALGVAGLAVLAMPADAGDEPELPAISADELVESVLSAEPPAFAGTVAVDNELGIPEIPGMDFADTDSARVYHDGDQRGRISVQRGTGEQTIVRDAEGVWTYDSGENTATWYALPADAAERHPVPRDAALGDRTLGHRTLGDPAAAATEMIDKLSESSTILVDGTARVADRPAYELVLTPKPSERTLLREIKVAIDSETRLPLRFQVLPNGSADPVLSVGFTDFSVGDQPDELFTFSPPEGATVVEGGAREHGQDGKDADAVAAKAALTVVGDGWDAVLTGNLPGDAPSGEREGTDPRALLEQVGERVTGEFGSGYVITTRAGTGLLSDDGRFAVGLVPQQVLIEALDTP
ncbi:MAG: LolA family protein [Haloechinothrix sp.]